MVHPYNGILPRGEKDQKTAEKAITWDYLKNIILSEEARHKRVHGVCLEFHKTKTNLSHVSCCPELRRARGVDRRF